MLPGFVADVRDHLQNSIAFVFISECEGSAKATYEAAACGLPQITTRESGDVVVDGLNGRVIPANDPEALAGSILEFYNQPGEIARGWGAPPGHGSRNNLPGSTTADACCTLTRH